MNSFLSPGFSRDQLENKNWTLDWTVDLNLQILITSLKLINYRKRSALAIDTLSPEFPGFQLVTTCETDTNDY